MLCRRALPDHILAALKLSLTGEDPSSFPCSAVSGKHSPEPDVAGTLSKLQESPCRPYRPRTECHRAKSWPSMADSRAAPMGVPVAAAAKDSACACSAGAPQSFATPKIFGPNQLPWQTTGAKAACPGTCQKLSNIVYPHPLKSLRAKHARSKNHVMWRGLYSASN